MKDRVGSGVEAFGWHHDLLGGGAGVVEPLGPDHAAIRAEDDAVLLVTFERARDILAHGPGGRPLAAALAEDPGWSRLTVVARGETWFRDRAVFAFFDRLIDEGYFDRFDRVVFYGDGMCGHAAAAFSVAAPGAKVVALAPQATLDPARAGWDPRFATARRLDFTSRFGFAPDMVEAAELAMIVYDPLIPLDAMHAALFRGPNVVRARTPLCGEGLEGHLRAMGVLSELIDAAGEGQLSAQVFHRLFRARRQYPPYLSALMERAARAGRPGLGARAARSGRDAANARRAPAPKPLDRFVLKDTHRVPAGAIV
ncbi:MAG: phosphoadenosine phosphosulfate reductase [Rhodovulum sp.]